MDFVNISRTISANDDDDLLLEIQLYKDAKHVEDAMKAMEVIKWRMNCIRKLWNLLHPHQ